MAQLTLIKSRGRNIRPDGLTIYGTMSRRHQYKATPSYLPDSIPGGVCANVDRGVFLKRCRGCDDYMLTYGGAGYVRPFAEHEATHPELLGTIAGYDLALLP